MLTTRLTAALDQGLSLLPSGTGPTVVFGARAGDDLGAFGDDIKVIQTQWADVTALQAAGYSVAQNATGPFAAALVVLPRAKDLGRHWIARAMALTGGGPVWIDGQKTDGIDGMLRTLRGRGVVSDVFSKAHGKLFCLRDAELADWIARPKTVANGFITAPGVFSADGIDPGSARLVAALPTSGKAALRGKVVDLGAGWGYLARHILDQPAVTLCHLVDSDLAALDCARHNVTDPRATFHWADGTAIMLPDPVDHVVSNPPFHTARRADPAIGKAFIRAAARLLKPSGQLWLVANRHLPYEQDLNDAFTKVTPLSSDAQFKVFHAERPRRREGRTPTPN